MRKLLIWFIAALLLPAALAAPQVSFNVDPSREVFVNQEYVITVTATDSGGIDSIVDLATGSTYPCGGRTTCTTDPGYKFIQSSPGQYVHSFYARPSGGEQGTTSSVTINVKEGTSTQPESQPEPTTYTVEGAGDDEAIATLDIDLIGNPAPGTTFTLRTTGTDSTGLDSIHYFNASTQSWVTAPCGGKDTCQYDWKITESAPGSYVYNFVLKDTSGHGVTRTYNVNVGTSGPTTAAGGESPTVSTASSPGTPGPTASFKITPAEPMVGDIVTFDATGSSPSTAGGTIVRYAWDVDGDDVIDIAGEGPIATHTYNNPGTYDIRLEVTDSSGMTSYQYSSVAVSPRIATSAVGDGLTRINVLVNDNGPVEGANVQLTGNQTYAMTTDPTGLASFQVQPGCYDITAEKDGENYGSENVCVTQGETREVSIGGLKTGAVGTTPWIWILVAIVAIAIIGGGVYYFMDSDTTRREERTERTTFKKY